MNRPLVITHGTPSEDGISFVTRVGECVISNHVETIMRLLPECNGINTVSDIADRLQIERNEIDDLLTGLAEYQIVIDSSETYKVFYEDILNESPFRNAVDLKTAKSLRSKIFHARTPGESKSINLKNTLDDVLMERRTVRDFDSKSKLQDVVLTSLLKKIYFYKGHTTVPSAGAIYPLNVYVIILRVTGKFSPGLYGYDPVAGTLTLKKEVLEQEKLSYIFSNVNLVSSAQFIITLSADLSLHTHKYGNRGFIYSYIEAGHVAQNLLLQCATQGVAVLEYGGFLTKRLSQYLQLEKSEAPLLAFFCGTERAKTAGMPTLMDGMNDRTEKWWRLMDTYVGEGKMVEWLHAEELTYKEHYMPRVTMLASFISPYQEEGIALRKGFSYATGYDSVEASTKSIAEAVERYASGIVKVDAINSLEGLQNCKKNVCDPRILWPINSDWYRHNSERAAFQTAADYEWVEGISLYDDRRVYVLTDLVYYPLSYNTFGRKPVYTTSSNGVAAHFDKLEARKKALLELIERDAICTLWYGTKEPKSIPLQLLGSRLLDRSHYWREDKSCEIQFLDITVDTVPTVLIIMRRKRYPYFVCGAASAYSYDDALLKAFDEMESTLLSWMRQRNKPVPKEDIIFPHDHGIYYANSKDNPDIHWLFATSFSHTDNLNDYEGSFEQLVIEYKPIEVVLKSPSNDTDLWVLRHLSEKLMPINFGYGNEPFPNKRMKDLGINERWCYPAPPHFFP